MKQLTSLLVALFLLFTQSVFSQGDSTHVRLSVLTLEPGNELYSTFGHSAIRFIDSTYHKDLVFNWGTFDFSDPDFYSKFVRGKLDYFLSVEPFESFLEVYKEEKRSIWEQELTISEGKKHALIRALQNNLADGNRYYKYDILADNCTTRIRDLLFNNLKDLKVIDSLTDRGITYRNLLHEYLDEGAKPWSKLGIDILLGSKLDKPVSNYTAMFLPDYVMQGLDMSNYSQTEEISPAKMIYSANPPDIKTWKYAPLMIFSICCVLLFIISLLHKRWAVVITKFFDSFFLYLTGILGIFLIFMWFGTDHTECRNNFNLLWALPTNFIVAFFIWKRPLWVRKYFFIVALIYGLFLLSWFWIPQQINIALIPIVLFLALRCSKLASN
ncbi:DUF4105 domain-containing protein [Danxiaibacter flavus]|uniref:DUF4105 domain-containing protein n=1 Tax=Danxiaibacter flavus TaxID=3049108 RepID=A0ABV3ZD72_9BACT|nr:DUF4105 domain-containing protein [Chitinophagaceae bacterium DXS]